MRDSMDLMIQCLEILKEDSTRRGLERFLRTAARGLKLPALAIHLKQGERRRQLSCRTAGSRAVKFVFRLPLESRGVTFGTLVVGCNSLFQNLRVRKSCRSLALLLSTELGYRRREESLRRAAHADAFLKVKNRNAMEAHRRALMKRNAPRSVGVVYLDLNGLKQTNDRYGHKAGDRLLQRAVDFFAAYFPREHIYRAGGDEFVILESGLQEASFSVRVRNLRKALKAQTAPQAAMGAAWRAREGLIQEALDEADAEMYRDKNGAGRFRGTKKQKQI